MRAAGGISKNTKSKKYCCGINGEPAVIVTVPEANNMAMASIHIETRRSCIAALRVVRDPRKLAHITS